MGSFVHPASKAAALCLAVCMGSCLWQQPPPLTAPPDTSRRQNRTPLPPEVEAALLRVDDRKLVDAQGKQVVLRGITFDNQVSERVAIPSGHHSGIDFARVASMGMNSVRFALSYLTFEEDEAPLEYKESGWDWVDQNIEWAQAQGLRLVLVLEPRWSSTSARGLTTPFWEDEALQARFTSLWQAIAERYRAEPTILGFDLMDDPHPPRSAQWQKLAERTVSAIREVNQRHLLFIEQVPARILRQEPGAQTTGAGPHTTEAGPQTTGAGPLHPGHFLVKDEQVLYEFDFHEPIDFTRQGTQLDEAVAAEAWYPDPHVVEVAPTALQAQTRAESEPLPAGDSGWTLLETQPFDVSDASLRVGKPFLVCDAGKGRAVFDSLSLTKRAPSTAGAPAGSVSGSGESLTTSAPTETVFERDLDTLRGWDWWTENGEGSAHFEPKGQGDATALSLVGTTGPAHLGADSLRFLLEPGARYQLFAVARGEGLREGSRCLLRLEFYSSEAPVHVRDREFVRAELDAYRSWGVDHNVPIALTFGTIHASFLPGRGGAQWVSDVLEWTLEAQVHFAYENYHHAEFGLFPNEHGLPQVAELQRTLYELLVERLDGSGGLVSEQDEASSLASGSSQEAAPADDEDDSFTIIE